ncbi:hypothetical protein TraAM80_00247 [Trypanosoma rangeli]|uniref:Uncharacterized protein n=1 Tax=Trypanosoma rangeli TaxID=5698 RepID=A0A422P490_TRYRA|nr:uncharacterized protein TraAM80_00247 [Trypanosoma rangeli]RNF12531.1 hypothetical protein TraAM80_00247 [Trypanosoma rangeli]|eukprot:RNF12531.1 hypothetical protein TraAM80_00247 [Trypanosoma rangeli]
MGSKSIPNGLCKDIYQEIPRGCQEKISLLSREEVEAILHMYDDSTAGDEGMGEVTHSAAATVASGVTGQTNRLQVRLAGLPMFLQTEALVLRRHEQQYRQYMKELIEISECIIMVCDGTLRERLPNAASHIAEDSLAARRAKDAALRRMSRRAEEVEICARKEAVERVRSAQRMVLAAAVARHRKRERREAGHEDVDEALDTRRRRM